MEITQLRTGILESDLLISEHSTLENQVEQYNVCLAYLMDKTAPVRSKVYTERLVTPWYNSNIAKTKK